MVDKVLKFFISGNVALNQADNPYFQDLIRHAEAKVKGPKVNRNSVCARLNEVGLDAKEDFISLALDCWTSKNGYAFLGNIIVSYIFAQLFLNMSFCMLHADCDYCYNWTGRIGLIKIVWGPKVKSFKPSKHGSTSSILPSIYETDEQGIGSKKFSITQRN